MYPNLPLFYLEKVQMMLFSRHLTMFMCNIYLTVVHLKKKKSQSRHGALSFPFTGTAKVTSLERSWKTLVELNYS